jgi:hypothetical protein
MTTARGNARCRGSGLVALTGGLIVFLLLLLFAVQLSVNLYARSQVTAAGFDAARRGAGYENDQRRSAATVEAARGCVRCLDRRAAVAHFDGDAGASSERFRIDADPAALLVVFVLGSISLEFATVSMRQRARSTTPHTPRRTTPQRMRSTNAFFARPAK